MAVLIRRIAHVLRPIGGYATVLLQRIAQMPGLTVGCATVLCWVLTAFALADPDLSPQADLGGAKALFVVFAVLMTLLTVWKATARRRSDG